jgi:hypothetical protein
MQTYFVYFHKYYGSSIELSDNICKELGTNYKSIYIKNFIKEYAYRIKNSNIVFIKYVNTDLVNYLQNNNNKVIYFVVDNYPEKKYNLIYDGIIYSNRKQQDDFSQYLTSNNSYVYYHHYSPSYVIFTENKNNDIGYFVAQENVSSILSEYSDLIDIHTNFSLYKNFISNYKFHIEYRDYGSKHFLYKPCVKLSTSAYAESVFICSKDSSYSELLPKDYDYFLPSDTKEIKKILLDMNLSFNTIQYKRSIDVMKNLKNNLNIANTSKKLKQFLDEVYGTKT